MIRGLGDAVPDALHMLNDLVRSFCGLARKLLDLTRDNRKSALSFTHPRGFNGCLLSQQVRAFRDLPHQINNFANPIRIIGQAGYRCFCVRSSVCAALGPLGCIRCGGFDLADAARNLLRPGSDAINIVARFSSAIS